MKIIISIAALILLTVSSTILAQSPAAESWTGGFWMDGNWVAVNVRFDRQNKAPAGTADIIFPSYVGSENAINVALGELRETAAGVHFEIPARLGAVVFEGKPTGGTITGSYVYATAKGTFGLSRVGNVTVESLEKYYGAYRVSPDRVISIVRGWDSPLTLNYVDYKTGQIGTLWAASESEFFSGAGRRVSFPVALRVSFDKEPAGRVKSLVWRSSPNADLRARKIDFVEERLLFKNGDITLGGTLILPGKKGRHPVVIITPGDFGTNRDQLRSWAHNYVARGIGALVFDSRGAGESTGLVNSNSFSEVANDVLAIVRTLKTRDDVNPSQIGLFGFSNSAWTVALAASRSKDVAFLIVQSMSGVQPWRQESFRAETQLRVDNFPEATVKLGADFMRLKFETARTGVGWEKVQAIVESSGSERWLAYTNPPRSLDRLKRSYETNMTYDPVPSLENLTVPVLAYWGGKDTYVPATESIAVFEQAMARAGNKNYVVKLYPNGRHDLVEGETGSPSSGAKLKRFPAAYWKMKADWLLKHVTVVK